MTIQPSSQERLGKIRVLKPNSTMVNGGLQEPRCLFDLQIEELQEELQAATLALSEAKKTAEPASSGAALRNLFAGLSLLIGCCLVGYYPNH